MTTLVQARNFTRLTLCALGFLAGCGVDLEVSFAPEIDRYEAILREKTANLSCTENSQCRVLSMRPTNFCGSRIYIPYSTQTASEAELLEIEGKRSDLIYQQAVLSGEIPVCIQTTPPTPTARCEQQRCVVSYL